MVLLTFFAQGVYVCVCVLKLSVFAYFKLKHFLLVHTRLQHVCNTVQPLHQYYTSQPATLSFSFDLEALDRPIVLIKGYD